MLAFCKSFLALLTPGGRIPDAGCGSGRDTLHFKQHRFEVEAFDASHPRRDSEEATMFAVVGWWRRVKTHYERGTPMPLFNTYIGDDTENKPQSINASEAEDQRLRRNIQWGIVRGMFLYSLFIIPVALAAGLIMSAMNSR
jgi:hypothetical protein